MLVRAGVETHLGDESLADAQTMIGGAVHDANDRVAKLCFLPTEQWYLIVRWIAVAGGFQTFAQFGVHERILFAGIDRAVVVPTFCLGCVKGAL